jgi:hypothetical protein
MQYISNKSKEIVVEIKMLIQDMRRGKMKGEVGHSWRFFRSGGLDHVCLEKGDDVANLSGLDPKLWVALSCPTRGLEMDDRTLDLIDRDGDGRIRIPEVIEAVEWAVSRLMDAQELIRPKEALPLSAINSEKPEGKALLEAARYVLKSLKKDNAQEISRQDIADFLDVLSKAPFNGDGMISQEACGDSASAALVADILNTVGGKKDGYGRPCIDEKDAATFFGYIEDWRAWQEKRSAALVLGEATPKAYDALQGVRTKVEDFFSRCKIAAFDQRASEALNLGEEFFAGFAQKDLSEPGPELASMPLARVKAGGSLPLEEGLNPAWRSAVFAFRDNCARPFLGGEKTSLSEEEWSQIKLRLAPYEAWLSSWKGSPLDKLGESRLREIIKEDRKKIILELIGRDKALEGYVSALNDLERLVIYHKDLYMLLNNFVSFADFYSKDRWAIFQAGTLYLDGRSCRLCVRVDDPGRHSALAGLGKIYLAYCECTRKDAPQKLTIAAAFTAGDSDYLMVGRNGVFFDREGKDWDATIVKVIENPISIRQAVFAPYKRLARMISEQIEKMAASREKAVQEKAAGKILEIPKRVEEGKAQAKQPAPPVDVGRSVSIFAALAIAFGMVGSAAAGIVGVLMGLKWWQWILVPIAVFLIVSGPSVILAWLKLRQRTLGPVLEASGWAVNGRVKINLLLGRALTDRAVLPPGSTRTLDDPYAEKGKAGRWIALLITGAVIAAAIIWRYMS